MPQKWLVGVDLGGTATKLGITDDNGKMIHKWEIPTDVSNEGKNITGQIAYSIQQKLAETGLQKHDVKGIGIGAPGPADPETGVISEAVNLGWKCEYSLKEILEAETSLPVFVDNDANCAALGEMWKGAGSGSKDLVCVTLGTGVGGGIIANGQIVHGKNGAAGEIGHIISVAAGGASCNCGKTGCLETIASATGIVRLAYEQLAAQGQTGQLAGIHSKLGRLSAKDIFDSAKSNDTAAITVIDTVSLHLGIALANIANTLNPEKIIVGGGVSMAGDILLDPLRKYFTMYSFPRVAQSSEVTLATLGNDAGVIGASWLVKNGF
ncbi:ROK family glucokinase [Mesobacillus zeae]|uniref:Glucokinase n=1 Tax=Mesobacillus zeae TaxID=1917180 RepID=A0A398B1Y8_9BACI|nr:ROK family glucokinase [Mesobacillus zeae]RID83855.1 ROK family protein [Mesobacillus zeae]